MFVNNICCQTNDISNWEKVNIVFSIIGIIISIYFAFITYKLSEKEKNRERIEKKEKYEKEIRDYITTLFRYENLINCNYKTINKNKSIIKKEGLINLYNLFKDKTNKMFNDLYYGFNKKSVLKFLKKYPFYKECENYITKLESNFDKFYGNCSRKNFCDLNTEIKDFLDKSKDIFENITNLKLEYFGTSNYFISEFFEKDLLNFIKEI